MRATTYSPTLVWGGRSCPPPLILGLLWTWSEAKDEIEVKIKVKCKGKIKGSGQECPLHTTETGLIECLSVTDSIQRTRFE